MAYNHELTQRVRQALTYIPNVEEKKMFGSIGFMVNGKLCIGVGNHQDHQMMVRVGPEVYEEALNGRVHGRHLCAGKNTKAMCFLLRMP